MTTTPTGRSDSGEVLREAAITVGPELRAHAPRAERENRLSDESGKALRDAGLFKLGVPRIFGGFEAGLATAVDVIAELARACPSSSWIVGVSYGAQNIAARFPEPARQELWAENPDQAFCGSFNAVAVSAVRVDGGQIVSGRWTWASGAYQADWAVLAVPVVNERSEVVEHGLAVAAVSELSIEDTWDMAGMRGTGTHTLVGEDLFIPDHRISSLPDLMACPATSEPAYRISLGSLAPTLVATMLGAAEEIYARTMRVVAGGKPMADSVYEHLADSPSIRSNIANARNLIDSARLHLFRSANHVDATIAAGTELEETARARVRMDSGYASKVLREAADLLLSVGGAGSFSATNPVQRYWRDLHTAARHPTISAELSEEIYGRALVGDNEPVSFLV